MTRETMIVSSRSLNHPFGLNHVRVWVGDGGIMKNVARPIKSVRQPLDETIVRSVSKKKTVADLLGEEQPPPTRPTEMATEVQHSISDKTCDNAAHVRRHPKERQPDGQLSLGVKVYGNVSKNMQKERVITHTTGRGSGPG